MNRAANSELLKDVDTVAAFANHLMQTKPVFVQAVAAMLASRKLYAASTYEIDALLQKIDFAKDGPKQTDSPPLEWTDGHKESCRSSSRRACSRSAVSRPCCGGSSCRSSSPTRRGRTGSSATGSRPKRSSSIDTVTGCGPSPGSSLRGQIGRAHV